MMDLQGQFLIAMPQLEDYFQNTVVYMCEHNEQGSMGLVINQPTDLSIAELYSKMNFMMKNDRTFSNELVLAGGPVHSERGFILHKKTAKEFEHSYKITDDMYLTTSADIVETFGSVDAPEKYLVALGCASWTAGQLEQEIADNAWLVAPVSDTILFETIYEDRYPAANQLSGINPHNFVFSQVGHSQWASRQSHLILAQKALVVRSGKVSRVQRKPYLHLKRKMGFQTGMPLRNA